MHGQFRTLIVATAVVGWLSFPTAQQPQAPEHDAHHHDVMTRGAQAMGFDQERTIHYFLLYEDGGTVEVSVKEVGDRANLQAARRHLQEIARSFKAGNFGKPAETHAREVPGTAEMARLKDRITYRYEETPLGGRVRLLTRDRDALAAVHAFLRFQIEDHRTGDPTVVQRSPARGRKTRED